LQWLQNPSHINGDNMNNVRHETSGTFRNKKGEYLKRQTNGLKTTNKNRNIRDL